MSEIVATPEALPKVIHHSRQHQQQDLGETIILFEGGGPGEGMALGTIWNADDYGAFEGKDEDVEIVCIKFADKVVRAYNNHDDLIVTLWQILYSDVDNHIPDELHQRARAVLAEATEGETPGAEPDMPETFAREIEALQRRANKAVRAAKLKGDEFHPLNVIDLGLFGLLMQAKIAAGMFPKTDKEGELLDDKRKS